MHLSRRAAAAVFAAAAFLAPLSVPAPAVAGCGNHTYSFQDGAAQAAEGAGSVALTIRHESDLGNCGGDDAALGGPACQVTVGTSNGTANAGADYGAVSAQVVSFACNATNTANVNVPILDDASDEADETFTASLSNPQSNANSFLGQPSTATVTILDDDEPATSIRFNSSTLTVGEGAGTVAVTVLRDGGTSGVVGADYDFNDSTATGDLDYTDAPASVTFGNGDPIESISISILTDTIDEPDETFTIVLSNPSGGATIGVPSTLTVTITDDDGTGPTIGFPTAGTSVPEDVGAVEVPVTCSEGADPSIGAQLEAGGTVTGEEATVEGQADCTPIESVLTVTILDDDTVEAGETIVLTLSGASGGATIGPFASFTITIAASDVQPDALISREQARNYRGRSIFNDDGAFQTIGGNSSFPSDGLTRFIRVRHDVPGTAPIIVKRNATPEDVSVRLVIVEDDGDEINITAASLTGVPVVLGGGEFVQLKLTIRFLRRLPEDATRNVKVTARRSSDGLRLDTVKARIVYRA